MRVVAGRLRGRRLRGPPGDETRPTTDRARGGFFDWVGHRVEGAIILDLFAGTGILGLEALSRDADDVWFVEADASLVRSLEKQIDDFEVTAKVFCEDVSAVLDWSTSGQFDVVFLDAPYELGLESILAKLGPWLAPRARIYIERPDIPGAGGDLDRIAAALPGAVLLKQGRAGRVRYGLLGLQE